MCTEDGVLLRTKMSRGHTKTLQGNPKLSGTTDDDSRQQGSMRMWLKLWCFATWCSLVLNLDWRGFRRVRRVRMRRAGVQRGQSMSISDWGTYKKLSTYKYWKEHSRVEGNGHGFGQKSIGTKIEQGDVMWSKTERGSGFSVRNGDWGREHETKRISETWNTWGNGERFIKPF